jgi:iron complex outermembrane receptor protein
MGDWKADFNGVNLKYTTAWMEDYLHYIDPNALINEVDKTFAWRNKFNVTYLLPCNLALSGAVNYDREQANIPEFITNKVRNITGLKAYADYYLYGQFRFHAGFREDLVDNQLSAFAPEASINYSPKLKNGNGFSANLMASRNFRFPTLDDLYWVPGGNPDLKEEKSWNGEIRAKYSWRKVMDVSVSNFYIYAVDWIQWIPEGNIWEAENFRRVFSRGVETAIHLTNAKNDDPHKFAVHFNASYSFTKTTNLDALSPTDLSQGKQLIYVPYHNFTAGLQFQYYRFYLRSVNTYTGPVFISTDNSQSLPGYFIPNLEAGKDFVIKKFDIGLAFRVNNIGNVQYQAVAQHPMPGRNFEGILRFKFFS